MKNIDIDKLITEMTLEEKASLMSGEDQWHTKKIDRLGVPSIMMSDGPNGLRKERKAKSLGLNPSIPATCFPALAALANSWDETLLYKVGEALGEETRAEGVSAILGPGLNIKRNPLCGRSFEYFSEDPYLAGKCAAAMIRGIQSTGVAACPKHFAVNSQELRRMVMDEVVDERSLREIYLEGFRRAVTEGKPKMLMSSYNKINGAYANENKHTMTDILRGEWGYENVVVTDWGGCNDRVAGIIAGNELEMPSNGGMTDKEVAEAVKNGKLSESVLDSRVKTLLTLVYDTLPNEDASYTYSKDEHHETARDAARRSAVLLKNKGKLLPLDKKTSAVVIGDFARTPRYQGAGSSQVNPTKLTYALDSLYKAGLNITGYAQGFERYGGKNDKLFKQALSMAKEADVIILFLGLDESIESEGRDRSDMKLRANQKELLLALKEINENIIAVLSCGCAVECEWDSEVKALLHVSLPGQAGGDAAADIISGEYNPSGKLSETYPIKYEDVPSAGYYPGNERVSLHKEGIFVGYRYYDTAQKEVKYPFGYGLSYTTFEYSDIKLNGNEVSFRIKNTGERFGEEISQIYVRPNTTGVFRAQKELCGFAKTALESGEESFVTLTLDEHAGAYFDAVKNKWVRQNGKYEILIGASSRDIRLCAEYEITGEENTSDVYSPEKFPHYAKADVQNIPDEEFALLLRYVPPSDENLHKQPLTYLDTISEGKYRRGFAKFLYNAVISYSKLCRLIGKNSDADNISYVLDLPYRGIARLTNGKVSYKMLDSILTMCNDGFLKGFPAFIKASRKKKTTA